MRITTRERMSAYARPRAFDPGTFFYACKTLDARVGEKRKIAPPRLLFPVPKRRRCRCRRRRRRYRRRRRRHRPAWICEYRTQKVDLALDKDRGDGLEENGVNQFSFALFVDFFVLPKFETCVASLIKEE